MKLGTLTLRHFRQHADSEVVLPARGIIGILGDNESGKTTIIEGIAWCLFGSRAVRQKVGEVRWHGAPDRQIAEGTLPFEIGGRRYRVERSENDATLYDVDADEIIAAGISAVDEAVPAILGADLSEWEATHLCWQKDLDRLGRMGPTARRRFVLDVTGVGLVERALETCRSKRNDLRREVDALRSMVGERGPLVTRLEEAERGVDDARATHEAAQQAAKKARTDARGWSAEVARWADAEGRHKELTARLEAATAKRAEAVEQLRFASDKLERAEEAKKEAHRLRAADRLSHARRRLREIEDALSAARQRAHLEGDRDGTRDTLRSLRRREAELEAVADGRPTEDEHHEKKRLVERAKATVERTRQHHEKLCREARTEWAHAEAVVLTLKKSLTSLQSSDAAHCPTCLRPFEGSELVEATAHVREEIEQAEATEASAQAAYREAEEVRAAAIEAVEREEREDVRRLANLEERIEECEKANAELQRIRAEIRREEAREKKAIDSLSSLPPVPDDASQEAADVVRAEVERLEQADRRAAALAERAAAAEEWRAKVDELDAAVAAATIGAEEAEREIRALAFDADALEDARKREATAAETASTAEAERARAEERWAAAETSVAAAKLAIEEFDERKERVEKVAAAHTLHDAAAERLDEFRKALAASIRPELEALVSGFVADLTDGRHEAAEITEDYDVVLYKNGVREGVVSGGAEDAVALAMRLAISTLISERAGHPLSLLIIDEPFSSQDAKRRQNVVDLLDRLGGVFEQVIVVTHVDDIRQVVDHAIIVDYIEEEARSVVR